MDQQINQSSDNETNDRHAKPGQGTGFSLEYIFNQARHYTF
jgi:hypothetical protein